ncbi:MAG: hypothetical protein ABIO04_00045 [Ferruginibacter sp.]
MKKILSIIAILAITLSATAQEKREMKHDHEKKEGHHDQENRRGHIMQQLDLTDAQKSQMKATREEYKLKLDQLKQNPNISVKEYNEKKKAIEQEEKAKIKSLLTPEQQAKMAEFRSHAKDKKDGMDKGNKRMERMKKELSLTDDQAAKLKAHNEDTHAKLKAIKENQSLSKEEKMQQMKALKESSKEQRKNILTTAQIKKMEEMRKEHKVKDRKKTSKK